MEGQGLRPCRRNRSELSDRPFEDPLSRVRLCLEKPFQGLDQSSLKVELARKLIDELSSEEFKPERYKDEYRERVLELVNKKVEGKEVTVTSSEAPRSQVIDLMDALKESLAKRAAGVPRKPPVKVVEKGARPAAAAPPVRKAQGGKK